MTTSDDEGVIRIYKRESDDGSAVDVVSWIGADIIATYAKSWKLFGKMTAEEPEEVNGH